MPAPAAQPWTAATTGAAAETSPRTASRTTEASSPRNSPERWRCCERAYVPADAEVRALGAEQHAANAVVDQADGVP